MSPHLAATIALYAGFVACWAVGAAVLRRSPGRTQRPALVALQLAAALQAVLDVAGLLGGHRPPSPAVHLGYVVASVVVLPIALSSAGADDDDPWRAAIVAVGCVATAVVALRLRVTWGFRA
jgi:hypothetical protein